jgi:two-component system, NtrC family, sensor histidine kinase HydH
MAEEGVPVQHRPHTSGEIPSYRRPWPGSLGGRLAALLTGFIVLATAAVVVREYGVGEERLVAETLRSLEAQAAVAADRLEGALAERKRMVDLWSALETSQDLAVDDVDKRLSESLADLVVALGSGTEAVAARRGGPVLAASDAARLGGGSSPFPVWVSAALEGAAPGVALHGSAGEGAVVAVADVISRVDGSALGRIVVWTPLRRFLSSAMPLDLDAVELARPDGAVLLHGERLGDTDGAYLWGAHTAETVAGPFRVSVGRPRAEVVAALRASGRQLVTLAAIFLLLAVPAALVVVWSATSGLGRLTRAAREMDARRPAPLPLPSPWAPDEVRVLAEALSSMVARLEEAREELTRSESLAAVGMLTKSLAHEIRTPLSVLRAGTEILARAPGAGPREQEVSAMLEAEVERLARLVDDLLVFGRPSPPMHRQTDLHDVCVHAVEALTSDTGEVGVRLALEGEACPLRADADQLRQVVLNLVTNGIRACEGGGTVTVRTRSEADRALLEVQDDGVGIAPDRLEEIWRPLVTTHRSGSGLGLPIVRQLVEAHGGTVEVRSTPGEGTLMRVTLPSSPVERR